LLYRAEAIKRANGVHFPEEVVTLAAKFLISFLKYNRLFCVRNLGENYGTPFCFILEIVVNAETL
jgi:hypothetical protein